MRLSFHTTVPGPIEEVYEHVTAMGPEGPVDRALFAHKYGEPVEEAGNVVTTRELYGESETFWRCTFSFPDRRTMEALAATWADREDVFEAVRGGTRWTVTFDPKVGGVQGLAQWLYFQMVGKYRVGVPVLSPVMQHFRRKARGEGDSVAEPEGEPPASA